MKLYRIRTNQDEYTVQPVRGPFLNRAERAIWRSCQERIEELEAIEVRDKGEEYELAEWQEYRDGIGTILPPAAGVNYTPANVLSHAYHFSQRRDSVQIIDDENAAVLRHEDGYWPSSLYPHVTSMQTTEAGWVMGALSALSLPIEVQLQDIDDWLCALDDLGAPEDLKATMRQLRDYLLINKRAYVLSAQSEIEAYYDQD